jgi:Flp pilus assembly protein TadG
MREGFVAFLKDSESMQNAKPGALRRALSFYRRDEQAAVTVEFVLWLPVFIIILFLIVEVSLLFLTQSSMWNVARDTARRIATHEFDQTEAEAHATSAMTFGGHSYTIAADAAGPEVSVTISASVGDVLLFAYSPMAAFAGSTLSAQVILREEPE